MAPQPNEEAKKLPESPSISPEKIKEVVKAESADLEVQVN